MKILNRALFISFLICIALLIFIIFSIANEIGDISVNKKTDNPDFHTKGITYQYYQANTKYKGERKAIRDSFMTKIPKLTTIHNGWIIIRFLINYEGATDRFRFFCIDENYQNIKLDNHEEKDLLKIVRSLHNWEIGKVNEKKVNSYYQITCKIENGKVIDIF
ncbi:hypothetical protein HHL23_13260 [Chryseobacterium sp. RP-3-3]|uniref:Uncharacterized protein n=1 Tax=Chryseobacterium antibioticum TaxID=2728847 RepID=A0A7Y0FSH4_9FLAO|nr:hypothetical protein [Chryseobacterium antibioticum]NML70755.1 hypothetical protein [Chryseobacterium antibioticum]